MELGLSLGDPSRPFGFLAKERGPNSNGGFGFCMGLGLDPDPGQDPSREKSSGAGDGDRDGSDRGEKRSTGNDDRRVSSDQPPLQLDLLPLGPVPRNNKQGFSWPSDNGSSEGGSSGQMSLAAAARGFDVNRLPPAVAAEEGEDGAALSSPKSVASAFRMDFGICRGPGNVGGNKRDSEAVAAAGGHDTGDAERASSRASDEDENGLTRKKLRLSKEQSAYLEESFKEHNTLNPKQKLALAKQLNLRPRQVEVWFQNRRARTKLKQTEVDCEYLKRCCEKLTEENRRLHKELQELRALKTSNPFYMQLPATTLTMCPSCERVATTTTTAAGATSASGGANNTDPSAKPAPFPLSRPRFYPFSHPQLRPHQSAAS
ncbi:hypothetical protein NMG60_11023313 [Bertholletia excelsa]